MGRKYEKGQEDTWMIRTRKEESGTHGGQRLQHFNSLFMNNDTKVYRFSSDNWSVFFKALTLAFYSKTTAANRSQTTVREDKESDQAIKKKHH